MDTSLQPQMNDKIAESLDIEPLKSVEGVVEVTTNNTATDYDYARGNLVTVIEKGQEALSDILAIAQQSQQPRAFEVVSDLIKTLSQSNKDLLDLMKQKKDIEKEDGPKTVNNNLFVGSTAELLKIMKKEKDG